MMRIKKNSSKANKPISSKFQYQLWLRFTLLPAHPATHPPTWSILGRGNNTTGIFKFIYQILKSVQTQQGKLKGKKLDVTNPQKPKIVPEVKISLK